MSSMAHPLSPSRVRLQRHKAKAHQPGNRVRRVAQAMQRRTRLLRRPLLALPFLQFHRPRLCQVRRMYVVCLCPRATRPLEQAAANAHPLRQVQFPRLRQAVSWQFVHDEHSRDIVGSCVTALARRSYQSLTARMTAHLARDNPRLMVRSRRESAKTLLVSFLHLPPSRVPGHPYLAHAMAAQPHLHGSAAPSVHALDCGILAQVQVQAAVVAHDTIHTFQYLARHLRSVVPARTVLSMALAAHHGPASNSCSGVSHGQGLPPLLAPCAWATHLMWMGARAH